jgi:hypothetical protein
MSQRPDLPKKVIPFAPTPKPEPRNDRDPMDRSGEAIVALVERAAVLTKDDCDRAMALAHHLSIQLRAAEDRAAQLQAQIAYFQDRATRAENWLARIHHEIKERLVDRGSEQPRRPSAV